MQIEFFGATHEVTGSCFLLRMERPRKFCSTYNSRYETSGHILSSAINAGPHEDDSFRSTLTNPTQAKINNRL